MFTLSPCVGNGIRCHVLSVREQETRAGKTFRMSWLAADGPARSGAVLLGELCWWASISLPT